MLTGDYENILVLKQHPVSSVLCQTSTGTLIKDHKSIYHHILSGEMLFDSSGKISSAYSGDKFPLNQTFETVS